MDTILQENIIKDLGLDALPESEREEALMSIGKMVFQGVLMRAINELSDEDAEAFGKLMEEKPDDQQAVLDFLQSKVSNFDEIVKEEAMNFKRDGIDFMKKIKV